MRRLKEVIISITNKCNSSCRMCDIPKEVSSELSTGQWKEVVDDISTMGIPTVVFSGGEPLLRQDIFELISFSKNKGLNACITSNGILVSDVIAKRLAKVKIDVVNISIEGPQEIHDYLRGKGSFDKAKDALKNLKKYDIEATLATVISRYNYSYLDYISELANEIGATTVKFQPFSTLFIKDRSRKCDFFISQKESTELKETIERIISSCDKYGIASNPSSYLEKIPSYMSESNIKGSKGCQALWATCPINADGEIYPCWVLSEKDNIIGSIREKRFNEIWNSRKHNLIRERIVSQGCPGCMMSCYDGVFGIDSIERKIIFNAGKIKKEGFFEYLRHSFMKLVKRIRFYSSYRGPLRKIIARVGRALKKRNVMVEKLGLHVRKEEINKSLQEIAAARVRLEEVIRK
ncbi:radical SAM protein [bacterium]|nr:radical SAM protein [bacterium]